MNDKKMKSEEEQKEENALGAKMKRAHKAIKHFGKMDIFPIVLGILSMVIILALAILIIPIWLNAKEAGSRAGEALGGVVGCAVGSFQGITEGIPQGMADGKEEGLSVKDTEVEIGNKIEKIGNLEVLKAGVKLDNCIQIADNYLAIYVYKADAIFVVNLAQAEIVEEEQGNKVTIILAEPSVEVYINDAETNKITEWQKHFYSGKAADGYEVYINARTEMEHKAPEEIANYDTLMELAKDSAKKQVTILAEAICAEKKVDVIFADESK